MRLNIGNSLAPKETNVDVNKTVRQVLRDIGIEISSNHQVTIDGTVIGTNDYDKKVKDFAISEGSYIVTVTKLVGNR